MLTQEIRKVFSMPHCPRHCNYFGYSVCVLSFFFYICALSNNNKLKLRLQLLCMSILQTGSRFGCLLMSHAKSYQITKESCPSSRV